ncbi:MAG: nitrite/sulfite reductase [Armatimonadota bacterium]
MDATTPNPVVYHIPEGLAEKVAEIRAAAAAFAAGEIAEADLKALTGPMGLAEQREAGLWMLRPRLVAAAILPHQMRALADISSRYGSGVLHFTTRQNVQIHGVPLANVAEALEALHAVGLATKGAGGNAVRNVATCPDAGVCPQQAFDTEPHAVALTEFLLPDPASYKLPRKYKIAISGCARDCAGAAVADLGLIATVRNGVRGFVAYAGGGLGARSAVGHLLEDFIPESDIYIVAEAIKRVFNKHGNRENRGHARIRFLIQDLGFEKFAELYREELAQLRLEAPAVPTLRPVPQPNLPHKAAPAVAGEPGSADFQQWLCYNVTPQARAGQNQVILPLPLGDIQATVFADLAAVVEEFGEGVLRASAYQNALLRSVADDQLPALYDRLAKLGLTASEPPVLQKLISCTGALTCRPGLLHSRGLATAIVGQLRGSGLDLASLGDLEIKVSGCPNACSRHPVADIGLSGVIRRVGDRPVPHYVIHLGGIVRAGDTRLAKVVGTIPGRSVPAFVAALLKEYAASPQLGDFASFVEAHEAWIAELIAAHAAVRSFEEDSSYFCEWGSETPYSPRS